MSPSVTIRKHGGSGRAFVIIAEDGSETPLIEKIYEGLISASRCIICIAPQIHDHNWRELSESLRNELRKLEVRQVSFVAVEDASILVQHISLLEPKFVRSVVLIDGVTSPHPSTTRRIADFIEKSLPLGLPLRSSGEAFDGTSSLQRIRCPVLVVTRIGASEYYRKQATILGENLSTCWSLEWDGNVETLTNYISEFQGVPVKCPQKGKGEKVVTSSAVGNVS